SQQRLYSSRIFPALFETIAHPDESGGSLVRIQSAQQDEANCKNKIAVRFYILQVTSRIINYQPKSKYNKMFSFFIIFLATAINSMRSFHQLLISSLKRFRAHSKPAPERRIQHEDQENQGTDQRS